MVRVAIPFLLVLATSIGSVAAHESGTAGGAAPFDTELALEKSEAAIGGTIGDYTLINAGGETFSLSDYRGRPLVISLIYTSCSAVCPLTTQHLIEAVSRARKTLGADRFSVLTVSFDPRRDTPQRLAAFMTDQGVDLDNWQAATGDHATIDLMMADLGFSYRATAGGFDHVTQTTIVDANGRVHRQVYGDSFPIQVFLEPLKEVVFGTTVNSLSLTGLVDRIRFICTVYDPSSGAYRIDYAIAFGISIGGLSLLLTGLIVFRLWQSNRRRRSALRGVGVGGIGG